MVFLERRKLCRSALPRDDAEFVAQIELARQLLLTVSEVPLLEH